MGDYVLSGGEIPAMVLLDGVVRLLPGALGHPDSAQEESFEDGLLDYPQYTRPPEFHGRKVPDVLLSGNHQEIEKWRREQALRRTLERRKDLLERDADEKLRKRIEEAGKEETQAEPAGIAAADFAGSRGRKTPWKS